MVVGRVDMLEFLARFLVICVVGSIGGGFVLFWGEAGGFPAA